MERFHGGNKTSDQGLIVSVDDFIPHCNVMNPRLRMKRPNMGSDPLASGGQIRQAGDLAVADCHRHQNAGAGESSQDIRIRIEDLHAVDFGFCFDEVHYLRRRSEVVCQSAVVDTDGDGGGGDLEKDKKRREETVECGGGHGGTRVD